MTGAGPGWLALGGKDLCDLRDGEASYVLQLFMAAGAEVHQVGHPGIGGFHEDGLPFRAGAVNAELDALALASGHPADEVLGGPDRPVTRQVAQPRSLVDGLAQDRELDRSRRLEGSQPFLSLVEAGVEVELVGPPLAQLPLLADASHRRPELVRAHDRVHDVAAIRLREKVIHHPVAHVLAVGAVELAEYRAGA